MAKYLTHVEINIVHFAEDDDAAERSMTDFCARMGDSILDGVVVEETTMGATTVPLPSEDEAPEQLTLFDLVENGGVTYNL